VGKTNADYKPVR